MRLPLNSIRLDGGTQSRAATSPNTVDEYAEAVRAGVEFPPVVVFFDGERYWLADGFHRHAAHIQAGVETIAVDVREGTVRDAILHSVGVNANHGLRRTNEDKRRAVRVLLQDAEWGKWSNAEIARRCSVDDKSVAKYRAEITSDFRSDRIYATGCGRIATMAVGGIGRRVEPRDPAPVDPLTTEARTPDARGVIAGTPSRQVLIGVPYTSRMKSFVAAAIGVATATNEEVAGIPANDTMLQSLIAARDMLDRIINHHSKERKHA